MYPIAWASGRIDGGGRGSKEFVPVSRRSAVAAAGCAVLALWFGLPAAASESEPGPGDAWCAPELESVTSTVCYHAPGGPSAERPGTLVIFLHSLIGEGSSWAWQQQRLMMTYSDRYGFNALIPKGRGGLGPGRDPNVLAWPTARTLQEQHEDAMIEEWTRARALVEKRSGSFDKVFVFGFSNGAYFATSLALRGKLAVDGYGAFAGGNGGKYHSILAQKAPRRVPLFVGYGTKDPDHLRQEGLVKLLRQLGWPHRSRADRVGHTVTDAQVRGALTFLGHSVTKE